MRYSADHKAQTREKLLASSAAIAKHGGFASTGVDGLMKAIGLSGGAFYSHFPSKDELFGAIVERELGHSLQRLGQSGENHERLQRCLRLYLDIAHVQQPDAGCALPSLGAEISRAGQPVRERAEHWLVHLQQAWAKELDDPELAWAIIAQCVGALLLARMLASPQRQQDVLDSSLALLVPQLAGTGQPGKPDTAK